MYTFSFKKMLLKFSSGNWRSFCLGLNVLKVLPNLNRRRYLTRILLISVLCCTTAHNCLNRTPQLTFWLFNVVTTKMYLRRGSQSHVNTYIQRSRHTSNLNIRNVSGWFWITLPGALFTNMERLFKGLVTTQSHSIGWRWNRIIALIFDKWLDGNSIG